MHLSTPISTTYSSQDMETTQVPVTRFGLRRCGIFTQGNITQPWKEWNIAICSDIDGPR